ncbi:MAG: sulfite exporter TauE/SafE family protein, partial [Cellulomonas sp.]|nr:sulfite exporter TauE/SafE family protein [Cellulomonas sp.]
VWAYHAHADWTTLRRMVPAVLVGIGVGAFFLATADDAAVRRIIGVILLALVAVTLARRAGSRRRERRSGARSAGEAAAASAGGAGAVSAAAFVPVVPVAPVAPVAPVVNGAGRRFETTTYGVLAGFTTMVANAGGPVMSLYFLAARFSVNQFLGTAAWFFLAVNLAKSPFSISLGLISAESLRLDLVLAPAVVVGALVGRRLARRINQTLFDRLILALTILSASYLLL